jgi:hypothetical protein
MSIVSLVARHSRYVLIFILCLFSGLFLLASRRRLPSKSYTNFDSFGSIRTIKSKLEQSETIYWNTLDGRKELIRKFGPDPSQIDAYAIFSFYLAGTKPILPRTQLSTQYCTMASIHYMGLFPCRIPVRPPQFSLSTPALTSLRGVHGKLNVLAYLEMEGSGSVVSAGLIFLVLSDYSFISPNFFRLVTKPSCVIYSVGQNPIHSPSRTHSSESISRNRWPIVLRVGTINPYSTLRSLGIRLLRQKVRPYGGTLSSAKGANTFRPTSYFRRE